MNAHKIAIKLFASPDDFHSETFVGLFHKWIQTHAIPDHLLIDVADYAHVPDGPGTVLVCHEANIYSDREAGRFGLLYARKQPAPGSFTDRLRQAIGATLRIAQLMESDPAFEGRLKFRTDELSLRINDRLLAPNTPETFAKVKDDVQTVATDLLAGATVTLEHDTTPAAVFTITIRATGGPPLASLADRFAPAAV